MRRRGWILSIMAGLLALATMLSGVLGCAKKQETAGGTADTAGVSPAPAESAGAPGGTAGDADFAATKPGDPVHGKKIFEENNRCVVCHGPQGRGDGAMAASLNPKPRNYHETGYMDTKTDAELFHSVKNGKSQMPAWGQQGLSDQDIRDAIAYVRQLEKS